MTYCSNCGTGNKESAAFCNNCGAQLHAPAAPAGGGGKCQICGANNPADQVFCVTCGARLTPAASYNASAQANPPLKGLTLPTKRVEWTEPPPSQRIVPTPPRPVEPPAPETPADSRPRPRPLSSRLSGASAESPAATPEEKAWPDWVKRLRTVGKDESSPALPVEPQAELPATAEQAATPEPVPDAPAVPDWLREFRRAGGADAESPSLSPSPETAQEPESSIGLPSEWEPPAVSETLGGPSQETRQAEQWFGYEPEPAEAEPPPAGVLPGLPDWLNEPAATEFEIPSDAALVEPEAPAAPAPEPATEFPDWLSQLPQASQVAGEPPPEIEAAPSAELDASVNPFEGVTPPSLSDAPSAPAAPDESPSFSEIPPVEAIPAWLQGMRPPEASATVPSLSGAPEPEEPVEPMTASSGVGLPDWLQEAGDSETPLASEPLAGAEHLDWLLGAQVQADRSAPPPEAADLGEMPDWLREAAPIPGSANEPRPVSPGGVGELLGGSAEDELGGLTSGEVPEWLQALRPADLAPIMVPSPPAEETPESGLLAGVHGVLPVAQAVAQKRTYAPASAQPADGASVLETVLASPAELAQGVRAARPRRLTLSARVPLLLNMLLLAAVLLPFVFQSFKLPGQTETMAGLGVGVQGWPTAPMHDALAGVKPGAAVLLAFDYDAGQSGELDPAAAACMDDLLGRGVHVIALGATTTGPALAQAVYEQVRRDHPALVYGRDFVNLGYVPGGEAGLRGLADNGLAAFPADYAGTPLKQLPALASVKTLADMALTVEIAGSSDALKGWIEQVYARKPLPLAAAVSAAVAPQARTYVNTRQLIAVMSGLPGAAEYELLSNRPGRAAAQLDALSLASLALAAVVILANLLYWAGRGFRLRRTRR